MAANNAIHAGVVLPAEETRDDTCGSGGFDDRGVQGHPHNGETLGESSGGELVGGLMPGIVRLARHLERYDRRSGQGSLILTGSPLPLWRVAAGDRFELLSDGLGQRVTTAVGAGAERQRHEGRRQKAAAPYAHR